MGFATADHVDESCSHCTLQLSVWLTLHHTTIGGLGITETIFHFKWLRT